ncbi:uncharacterized protein LOC128195937 [Vigna angularis]|uniref:uncharacterized protein LOC128195937 n=1 Tax=Phaseolus angularis TaxID=3914 RepID=UPI0022B3FF8E|nr:uncharacterized protein LOC128195937 [Vigna angularis]
MRHEYKRRAANQHVWQLKDYETYFPTDLIELPDVLSTDLVFIPFLSDNHWWCYAFKVCTFEFFVIDSLGSGIKGRARIDKSMAQNMQCFLGLLTNKLEDSKCPLIVKQTNIPVQPNLYDCGVMMLKAIELWMEMKIIMVKACQIIQMRSCLALGKNMFVTGSLTTTTSEYSTPWNDLD